MSQQVLKAAAPVLRRMPLAATLLSGQVCTIRRRSPLQHDQVLWLVLLAGAVHS